MRLKTETPEQRVQVVIQDRTPRASPVKAESITVYDCTVEEMYKLISIAINQAK